jgi:hypothetical protein
MRRLVLGAKLSPRRRRLYSVEVLTAAIALSLGLFEVLHRTLDLSQLVTTLILGIVFLPVLVWGMMVTVLLLLADPDEFGQALRYAFILLVLVIFSFAFLYSELGLASSRGVRTHDFWICLYFSVETFTTLGYGDFVPTNASRPVAALEALCGYVLLGLTVASTFFLLTYRSQRAPAPDSAPAPRRHRWRGKHTPTSG